MQRPRVPPENLPSVINARLFEPSSNENTRRREHLPHAGSALWPLIAYDHCVSRFNLPFHDRRDRFFLAFEHLAVP